VDIILVPGLWLDGSSWERVVPPLEEAGHRVHPLTLPGLESRDADRSRVSLRDQVDAVVREIDAADGPVLLVGHSAGAGIASVALDARPDRVARAVYVGGFPAPDGEPLMAGFAVDGGDLPMPDWSEFDDADLTDLDDAGRERFRARAIPSPASLTTDPVRLSDDRRYDVPVTVVCPEFTSDTLRKWIEQDLPPVREFTKVRTLEYVDLPTGHWPQFTRPDDLARILLERAA
jgi:pimeloyl-ACP methyl ester carboxylesterase